MMIRRGKHVAPRQKGKGLRRFGRAIPLALVASLVMATVALADNLSTNGLSVNAGTSFVNVTLPTTGNTTVFTVSYTLQATGGDGNTGCNVTESNPGTLGFESLPTGVSVTGGTSWTSCTTQNVTFSVSDAANAGTTLLTTTFSGGNGQYSLHNNTAWNLVLQAPAAPGDTTAPTITITTPGNNAHYTLNEVVNADFSCVDNESTVTQCEGSVDNGDPIDTSTPGAHTFRVDAASAGGTSFLEHNYYVDYAACGGAASIGILQPINADGSSVFKQKSTVPAKFQVCDVNGNPVGTAGVVESFHLVKITNGTPVENLTEAVDSTVKATSEFRYDSTAGQWIFNMTTKSQLAGKTYYYKITLDSGQTIEFSFGLK